MFLRPTQRLTFARVNPRATPGLIDVHLLPHNPLGMHACVNDESSRREACTFLIRCVSRRRTTKRIKRDRAGCAEFCINGVLVKQERYQLL